MVLHPHPLFLNTLTPPQQDHARFARDNAQRIVKRLDVIQDGVEVSNTFRSQRLYELLIDLLSLHSAHSCFPVRTVSLKRTHKCSWSDCLHIGTTIPLYAVAARYDCHPDRRACLETTRTKVLDGILTWAHGRAPSGGPAADSASERPIFWLNGLAGTGKTTVAYTVAERCHEEHILGASFFCSRSDSDCNNPSMIFTTIAYQLGLFYPPYRELVAEILRKDPLLVYSSVSRQFEELIVRPLESLRDHFPLCLVVIDALDECRDKNVTSAILSTLLKYAEALLPLRFFVTSRPESHLVTSFDAPGYQNAFGKLLLHEVALDLVTADIHHYLTTSLAETGRRFKLPDSWPAEADVDTLSRLANGLFIFAATAVKFIEDQNYNDPDGQLKVLTSTATSRGSHRLLDDLYLQVLHSAFPGVDRSLSGRIKSTLGSIVVIRDSLPPADLSRLVELPPDTVYTSLVGLHSVLVVPESTESTANIRIIHPTFAEFLLDSTRCTSRPFVTNSRHQHTLLLHGCLSAMRELKRDICDIRDPSLLNIEVPGFHSRMAEVLPSYLRYACRHWPTHLSNGDLSDDIVDALVGFAENRLLYWVEACSLLGILRDAISGLNESQRMLVVSYSAFPQTLFYKLPSE